MHSNTSKGLTSVDKDIDFFKVFLFINYESQILNFSLCALSSNWYWLKFCSDGQKSFLLFTGMVKEKELNA